VDRETGYAAAGDARLYYEVAGVGDPLVLIHAAIADRRQWDHEFETFSQSHRVLRYDQRGHGLSLPVEGIYDDMQDLLALLDHLGWRGPLNLIGCSMGGGLAMDFALAYPDRVNALVMVSSAPSGLYLDVPLNPLEEEAEKAHTAGDLDLVAELQMQMFFDGMGREEADVDPAAQALAYEMSRLALEHESKGLGQWVPEGKINAPERLGEIRVPVLAVVGEFDEPYIHAAADYMAARIADFRRVTFPDAAHLVNMDQPKRFEEVVGGFMDEPSFPKS